MDVLLDSLRATLSGRKTGERIQKSRADLGILLRAACILAFSFAVSRVSFFYYMYPCGIALMTVLMAKSKANIYALPFMLAGLYTCMQSGVVLLGDMAALAITTVIFFIGSRRRMSMPVRAAVAAVVTVAVKLGYGYFTHILYLYDSIAIGAEALLILFFIFIFYMFFPLVDACKPVRRSVTENILVFCIVGMVIAAGILPSAVGLISPVYVTGMFLTLLIGSKLGTMEGALAGVASGMMLVALTSATPAIMGILACGGMAAGLLAKENKGVTAICFAAVCLIFGIIRGYPNLYMSVYEPVVAAAVFLAIPGFIMKKSDLVLAKVGRDDTYYELMAKNRISEVMMNYRETFENLAIAYSKSRPVEDELAVSSSYARSAQHSRSIMAYQFRGMAKAIDTMMQEVDKPQKKITARVVKYGIKLGISSYARTDGISGDSYLCTDFRQGEYMVALSDGMGKGWKAAEESNLTVNTLYNLMKAGFDAELALKIINSILLVKATEEIFSTVDLALINLCSGRMKLFKIGAAATFVKRGDEVEVIKVSALPIGIVDRIPVESIEMNLKHGDQVIVVSDGITEADRSSDGLDWLTETIKQIKSKDPQTMSDLIINKAIERCGLRERDDMTVIVTSIE